MKQSRAWTWVKPRELLANAPKCTSGGFDPQVGYWCRSCPLSPVNLPETAGLLWVGEKFYPTAEEFMFEANRLGVSRRIPAIPRNFKLGQTWVLIAHPKAVHLSPSDPRVTAEELEELRAANVKLAEAGEPQRYAIERPGIITMFKPRAIEKIVTDSQAKDEVAMVALREKGITPVAVRDDDKDHQGSAHDKEEETANGAAEPAGELSMGLPL